MDVVLRLGLSVVIGLLIGFTADGWMKTSPIFTLVGLAVGVGAAAYTIWDITKRYTKR